jgi:hypothetical protein
LSMITGPMPACCATYFMATMAIVGPLKTFKVPPKCPMTVREAEIIRASFIYVFIFILLYRDSLLFVVFIKNSASPEPAFFYFFTYQFAIRIHVSRSDCPRRGADSLGGEHGSRNGDYLFASFCSSFGCRIGNSPLFVNPVNSLFRPLDIRISRIVLP